MILTIDRRRGFKVDVSLPLVIRCQCLFFYAAADVIIIFVAKFVFRR